MCIRDSTNPIAPVELFPITEGKLAVSIADEVLILHSPTEKQLSAYLEQNTLPAAAELVLSANHLSSGESMAQYAEAAGAQHIIIAASSETVSYTHLDVYKRQASSVVRTRGGYPTKFLRNFVGIQGGQRPPWKKV